LNAALPFDPSGQSRDGIGVGAVIAHDVLRAAVDDVHRRLEDTAKITTPGEKGRARENVMRDFLRSFVPGQFGIDTGFIIDVHGNISEQLDIVIYRTDYHPVFDIGGVKHFMVESVAAVFQNRSDVSSTRSLASAIENIRSVRRLDRTGAGHNYVVMDFHGRGPSVDGSNPQFEIFTGIIAQRSLSVDTFRTRFLTDLAAQPRKLWPHVYVDVDRFCTIYLTKLEPTPSLVLYPEQAEIVALTGPDFGGQHPPLMDFARLLADSLRTMPTIDFDVPPYFPANSKHAPLATFPPEEERNTAAGEP
jgi:hypothetical protein